MLCENPILKFKLRKNEYYLTSENTKYSKNGDTCLMNALSFEDKKNFLNYYRKNMASSNPFLEWLKKTFPVVMLPCGKCIICQYRRSIEWAVRCWLEAEKYGNHNMFITLTYNKENEPINGVDKQALSKFMHNLRQYFQRKHNHIGMRFFGCGEYGRRDNRPHYHLLIFNSKQFGDEKEHTKYRGRILYQSKILNRIWGKGSCTIGNVTRNSAVYVTQYALKRVGLSLPQHLNPEFINMSRKKGIGFDYLYENINQIVESDEIVLPNGKKVKLPQSFNKKLKELIGAERYEKDIAEPRADKIKTFIAEEKERTGLSDEQYNKQRIEKIKKEIKQITMKFEERD